MNAKVIQAIMEDMKKEHPDENTTDQDKAEYLAMKLDECDQIMKRIASASRKRFELDMQYAESIKTLNRQIADIQNTCPHYDTTYYPDPSGNNDSMTVCNICGKEM